MENTITKAETGAGAGDSSAVDRELGAALDGLAGREVMALNALMSGASVTGAAVAAGVSRSTMYEWMKPGTKFDEALGVWKRDVAQTARNRLLIMTGAATAAIHGALKRGDARVALRLLERMGVMAAPPVGPTIAEATLAERRLNTQIKARKIRQTTEMEEIISPWDEIAGQFKKLEAEEGFKAGGNVEAVKAEDGEGIAQWVV